MKKGASSFIRKQYDLEKKWRNAILNSEKGIQRSQILKQAYYEVNQLMNTHHSYYDDLNEKAERQFYLINEISGEGNFKFLDIGCSSGSLVEKTLQNDWNAYGVDVEEVSIEMANDRIRQLRPMEDKVRFFLGELDCLEEKDFDIIFHSDVLEHIHPQDAPEFIQKSFNLLKQGGKLIVNTPYRLSGPKDISKYFVKKGLEADGLHLKEYVLFEMVELYKAAGFKEIRSFLLNPYVYPELSKRFGVTVWNTNIKVKIEKILKIIPIVFRNKIIDSITSRLLYSITIAIK